MSTHTRHLPAMSLDHLLKDLIQSRRPVVLKSKQGDVTVRFTGLSVDPAFPNNPNNTCHDWIVIGEVLNGMSQPPIFTGHYNSEKESGEIEWKESKAQIDQDQQRGAAQPKVSKDEVFAL